MGRKRRTKTPVKDSFSLMDIKKSHGIVESYRLLTLLCWNDVQYDDLLSYLSDLFIPTVRHVCDLKRNNYKETPMMLSDYAYFKIMAEEKFPEITETSQLLDLDHALNRAREKITYFKRLEREILSKGTTHVDDIHNVHNKEEQHVEEESSQSYLSYITNGFSQISQNMVQFFSNLKRGRVDETEEDVSSAPKRPKNNKQASNVLIRAS